MTHTSQHKRTLLIGIDDTDNLESRGTGFHARTIGQTMTESGWGESRVITRHQLLVSPLVAYTSHNSAACVRVETEQQYYDDIKAFCLDYLLSHSADGSDAGLCIGWQNDISPAVHQFGFLCKRQVVTQTQAQSLATDSAVFLQGLTGDHGGIIGALAAVGLSSSGSDGRMLWLQGMRERAEQTVSLAELQQQTGITVVQTIEGQVLTDEQTLIEMGSWPRAIWLGGKATLIVEPNLEKTHVWKVAAKDYLRQF